MMVHFTFNIQSSLHIGGLVEDPQSIDDMKNVEEKMEGAALWVIDLTGSKPILYDFYG